MIFSETPSSLENGCPGKAAGQGVLGLASTKTPKHSFLSWLPSKPPWWGINPCANHSTKRYYNTRSRWHSRCRLISFRFGWRRGCSLRLSSTSALLLVGTSCGMDSLQTFYTPWSQRFRQGFRRLSQSQSLR